MSGSPRLGGARQETWLARLCRRPFCILAIQTHALRPGTGAISPSSINDAPNDQASVRLTRRLDGARLRSLREGEAWLNQLWTFRRSTEHHGCGRGPQGPRHWPPAGNTTMISRWLSWSINQTAQGSKKLSCSINQTTASV